MKVTILQMLTGEKALQSLMDSKLPLIPSYRISKIAKQFSEELGNYREKINSRILADGELKVDKDGKPILDEKTGQELYHITDKDKKEIFTKEHEEMLKQEVELEFTPISLEELEGYDISPSVFYHLDYLFTE
jgi:hypothetical protein